MNKKDLEHTVKNLHLSPEAKDRIARYLDSIPKGEEVFHAEPIQRSFFLHHAGIGIAACALLAVGIGGIYAVKTSVPAKDPDVPSPYSSVQPASDLSRHNAAASLVIPDFSDKLTIYTFIAGDPVSAADESAASEETCTFSFALTAGQQRALSSVLHACTWYEASDIISLEGKDCLMLDFGDSALEIWLNPAPADQTFLIRYTADKINWEQNWYEADIQTYTDIMEIVGSCIDVQDGEQTFSCIPSNLYDADLRFSFISNPDGKDHFFVSDPEQTQRLASAFDNASWGYDAAAANMDVNAWATDSFLPNSSPTYCMYVHDADHELYRCTVWLNTDTVNSEDQIEFLHYTDGKMIGCRYSITYDEEMRNALSACTEYQVWFGYAPEKPETFRAVTIWDDVLLPAEELDLSQYEKLLADFNEEHDTSLTFSSLLKAEGYDYKEILLREIAVMTPNDFMALLYTQIGDGIEIEGQVNMGEEDGSTTLKPLGNAIGAANTLTIMNADLKPEADTFTYDYSLSNEDEAQAAVMKELSYVMKDLTAFTTNENPNPKTECLHIDTGSHNIRFYSLDATSVTTNLYVTFKGTGTDLQSYYVDIDEYNRLTDVLSDLKRQKDIEWQNYIDDFESQPAPPFADLIRETLSVKVSYYSLEASDGVISYFLTDAQVEEIAELFEKTTFTRHFDWYDNIGTDHATISLHDQKGDFHFNLCTYQENGNIVDLRIDYSGIADHDGTRTGAVCITVDDISMAEELIAIIEEGT